MNSTDATLRLSAASTAALLIASAQAPLGSTLIAVALPSIGLGIGADIVLITGLLVTGYLVVNVVCQGPAGKISDLVGHSRVLWTGIGLYVIGAVCGLLAQDVSLLFVSRCAMAAAGALVVPATLALLRLHVPQEGRGRIFGLYGATMGIAAAGGPALGGEIVSLFGWRAVFLANLPFLALSSCLLYLFPLPASRIPAQRSIRGLIKTLDFAGMGLLALSLAFLILASKLNGGALAVVLLASAIAGVSFVVWESKVTAPVFDPRLFSLPAFTAGTMMIALQNFAMYGLLFQLPQYFSVFRGTEPREIGYMLFVMMVGMVVAAPVGGQLTDRIGARRTAFLGSLLLLSGVVQLWHLASFDIPTDAVVALLMFGLGIGLCNAPAQAASMGAVEPRQAGMAAGVSSTMRYLGGILSILALGMVLGSDDAVSVARHVVMIKLFTSAIVLSALMSRRLPGAGIAGASSH
ncbi:Predicted arabinose efflux permease, MFS family [Jannaschia faecimaris]|uniref:Predicted arabinose efflux permease, MFS family n=1 Tax=Jannaschia faecimaris TaxID=1244108 RepID=A0A1H3R2V0_9RHOB|nr:MFS transporter [Jannaschia faecimaris]SDZ19926.1 Predicted arabinose efflux permease, MFS family [Jannaschia faecimaris]